MSWLDSIKSHIIEEEPQRTVSVPVNVTVAYVPAVSTPVAPAPEFTARLRAKLANPAAAIDKFEATRDSLVGIIPDADTLITAALRVLSSAGVTPAQLKTEYQARLNALELESGKFLTDLENQKKNEIDGRNQKIAQLNAEINSAEAQVRQLAGTRDALIRESADQKLRLDGAQEKFDASVAQLRLEITHAISRMDAVGAAK